MFKIFLFITTAIVFMFNIVLAQAPAIEWQRTIGGDGNDAMVSVLQTADGGYILGGRSESGISGDKIEASKGDDDYWVVKLDASGQNIEWQNTIGGDDWDYFSTVRQTADSGYIVCGFSKSGISGDKTEANKGERDYWVVKLDASGQNIEWQNTIGGSDKDWPMIAHQTADGGYIVIGFSESGISGDKIEASKGDADYWVVKLDASGQNIEWQNTIGGSGEDQLYTLHQTSDGGYILGGRSASGISGDKTENSIGGTDYWVVKLDVSGQNIEWQNTIGGFRNEELSSIQQTTDGGYILAGNSESGIGGDKTQANRGVEDDYWVVRLDSTGTILWDKTIGGVDDDGWGVSIQQTADGGYILGSRSESGISGDKTMANKGERDYWVVKLRPEEIVSVEEETGMSIPSKYSLLQNYPNPFNPVTNIKFDLPENGMVKLNIYNILGQKVLELVNRELNAGQYNYSFDAGNLPSGVYVYKLETKNYNQTRKMILMK